MTGSRGEAGSRVSAAMLASACAGDGVSSVFQPIVDVARGVTVGYEALARFDGPLDRGPRAWFAAAHAHGRRAELEAAALRSGLRARRDLPPNCFLTVNVSPDLLTDDRVRAVWREEGDLTGVVVELTEQARIDSYAALAGDLGALRAAGALVAVDDAGAGYAGLQHLLKLRPSMIKLDRELVSDVDVDVAKLALVEMIGTFAARIDAWLLAEGVEREGELDALASLGLPLAQGYLLGRPGAGWAELDAEVAMRLVSRHTRPATDTVRDLIEVGPCLPAGTAMRVNVDTPVRDALDRAITRTPEHRFEPLACTDPAGRCLGVVRVERMIRAILG